jgi:hypothetical protein
MKFQMRVDPIWRPLLLVGGATPGNSYVEVDAESVHFRFGPLFGLTVARANIASAAGRSWPLWSGIGWRGFGGFIALIGSTDGVVEMRLSEGVRTRLLVPWPWAVKRIAVSLEDAQGFIDAVGAGEAAT